MARLVAILATLVLILSLGNSAAAANPKGDVAKAVFVHYKDNVDANAKPAGKGRTCPDPTTCADYSWSGIRWAGTAVDYELNASSGPTGTATAIGAAFAAWTRPVNVGQTRFSVNGSNGNTSCSSAGVGDGNGVNQICFRNLGSTGTIAVTYVWYWTISKELIEADTVFNTQFSWAYTAPSGTCETYDSCNGNNGVAGTMDIRNIATHEFGHFLAFLGDLYARKDSDLTMNGYGNYAELEKDSLGKGDCLGIVAAYGGSCE